MFLPDSRKSLSLQILKFEKSVNWLIVGNSFRHAVQLLN